MGGRQQDKSCTGVVVTDMDGTLLRGNSWKWVLRIGLRHLMVRGKFVPLAKIVIQGLLRTTRSVSHEKMKYKVLGIFSEYTYIWDEIERRGREQRNSAVTAILDDYRGKGNIILLATAASDSYVRRLWDGAYIASPWGGPDLRGERKLAAIQSWITARDIPIKAFLTDHYDDLMVAQWTVKQGATVYLVNPSEKTTRQFNEAGIPYMLIKDN